MNSYCAWCGAPIASGPKCPQCGAIYAKAEAIRLHGRAHSADHHRITDEEDSAVALSPALNIEKPLVADPILERQYCMAALPIALILGIIFHAFSLGHFFQRTFLSMPVHEFGHAFTAWFCGHFAVPTVWKTLTADSRGVITPVAVLAAIMYMTVRAIFAQNRLLIYAGFGLLLLQVTCTLLISPQAADALIIFGGDAGAMIFGTLLMTTFFHGKNTQLYQGSLRWGFLVIGAAALVDTMSTWCSALADADAIPYGEIEGVGLSDPSRLVETYGWTQSAMVHRYVGLGIVCVAVLVCAWIFGIRKATQAVRSAADRDTSDRRGASRRVT